MAGYIIRRIIQMIPVILIIIVFNFTLIHLAPGDPATVLAGENATKEYIEAARKRYGLDKPLYEQLGIYLAGILTGDLGYSFAFSRPVIRLIAERIPATVLLVFTSQILSLVFGTLMGAFSAKKYGTKIDIAISSVSILMYSMPIYWFGLVLILVFGITFPVFPIWGMVSMGMGLTGFDYVKDLLWHLFLPALTLSGVWLTPLFTRLARSSVIEVMKEDYVTVARAKGLTENTVFFKHALRNALLPSVTQAGLLLGFVLGGALMTETVFAWPGLGRFMYEAVFRRDYPVLMGLFLVTSVTVVIAGLITDVVYGFLDPRVVYK